MGNRDRKRKHGVRMAASKGISLIVCALFLVMGISACGTNEEANSFSTLSAEIEQLHSNLSSKITEAETTLSGAKPEELADPVVLDQLKTQIDAAKNLSVDIPAMASDKSAIAQQVDDLTTLQNELQKQYDSLASAVSAIAASKQQLTKNIAAEEDAKAQEIITPKNIYSVTETDDNGHELKITVTIGSWIKGSETDLMNKAWTKVGGKGSMPLTGTTDTKDGQFTSNDGAFVFGTISLENTTPQYDPKSFDGGRSWVFLNLVANWPKGYQDLGVFAKAVQFNDSIDRANLSDPPFLAADMKSNKWGPVPFVIGVDTVFSPKYPGGNSALEAFRAELGGRGGEYTTFQIGKTW